MIIDTFQTQRRKSISNHVKLFSYSSRILKLIIPNQTCNPIYIQNVIF